MAELPKLTSVDASSFISTSEDHIPIDLPTDFAYDGPIIIRAPPKTNFWRQPPSTDVHNAPTCLIPTPIDIHKFHSARVTVSADWNTLYDQGGLILFVLDGDTNIAHTTWLKTGSELVGKKLSAMSVDTRPWSDAGTAPLENGAGAKTIHVEREVAANGQKQDGLRVYAVDQGTDEKEGIRLITSWFTHNTPGPDKRRLVIGIYAGRPKVPEGAGRENEELVVTFDKFKVKLFDN